MSGSGYRAWLATEEGGLVSLWGWAAWPAGGWAEARCSRHAAPAPVADCTCGIHVVLDAHEMLAYAQQTHSPRWNHLPCVIGVVEFEGPTEPGAFGDYDDPPSTVRARRARLVQLVGFAPLAEPLRSALREALGAHVVPAAAQTAPGPLAAPEPVQTIEETIFELSQRIVRRVLDARRIHAATPIEPAQLTAEANMAQELLHRVDGMRPDEAPAVCQELRNFLSVIGG